MDYRELMQKGLETLEGKGLGRKYERPGVETGYAARYNLEYFRRFGFKCRVIDSREASTGLSLFGRTFRTPIFGAALSGMHDITEEPLPKLAAGLGEAGSMMWLGISSPQEVRSVLQTGTPTVRIVKPFKDLDKMKQEIREAEAGGALAVGCDVIFSYGGKREERCFAPAALSPKSTAELKELVRATSLPFILKGILSPEDARKAVDVGAGGVVVSNHSAGILDYSAHPLEVLPEIREVIGDRMPIFADSGFRRGTDALKALALGADAVLMGTALILALAAEGSGGVRDMVNILTGELQRGMTLTGCPALSAVTGDILVRRDLIIS